MTPSELLLLCLSPLLLAPETRAQSPGEQSGGKRAELESSDWTRIHAAREAARHAVHRRANGRFLAPNPGQQWQAEFDSAGFTVTPDHGKWTWGLELTDAARGALHGDKNTITHRRDERITEWFVNDRHGLQQGWTVHRRPENGRLRLRLVVRGPLTPHVDHDGCGVVFREPDGGDAVAYRGLKAWDAGGRVLPARFELAGRSILLSVEDEAARYPVTIDPIAQQAYAKASNTGSDDAFGSAVAVSADTVVVGAPLESSHATGVNANGFNDYAAQSGAAYVFVRSGENWTQQAYLKASNTGAGDQFGWAVAVSGNTVVVGAHQEDSSSTAVNGSGSNNQASAAGAAYVFARSGTQWTQQAYLKAMNAGAGDLFGAAVAVAGDTVVVGANREASAATGVDGDSANNDAISSGAAYVFARSGTVWTQQAYLKASDTAAGAEFGSSLGLAGDSLVVGAPLAGGGAGAAYVFSRSGTAWSPQARLQASNSAAGSWFGRSVAISGDIAAAGAPGEASAATGVNGNQADTSAPGAGAVYAFARNGAGWSQQTYLKASNAAAGDGFGRTVALDGTILIAGAPGEDSAATGMDGNQSDNTAASSGAAYVFSRPGDQWSQHGYLKASNTGAGDEFGKALAFSGGLAVVGAARESGNALGINGGQSNNLSSWAGAAYLFAVPALGVPEISVWHEATELTGGGAGILFATAANASSVTRTVLVRNEGTEALDPGTPWIGGADAARFSVHAANLPAELAGGQEGTLAVTFSAPATGSYQAVLHLPSNDPDESSFEIALSASSMPAADLYAAWAASAGLAGPDASVLSRPFRDGVANLLKYAFNLDGDRPDVRTLAPGSGTAGLPVFRLVGSGTQAVLRAEYLRRAGSGLSYLPKISTSLEPGSFVPMGGTTSVVSISTGWERVVVEAPCDPAVTPRVFGIVEVILP